MSPVVSIIYVNYNTSDLLINSIISLEEQCKGIPFEVIIIDNASSTDEKNSLTGWLQQAMREDIKVIFSNINLGFAKANNLGVKHSVGKYLFFLNPDTLIINDVLKIFYSYLESSNQGVAACGGNLLRSDLSPNSSYGNFPGILLELCNVGVGLSFLLNGYYKKNIAIACAVSDEKIRKVPYIVGADVFIRSEHFKLIHGFDENYFMYYEETDLFLRFKKQGLESYLLPEAKIIHFEGGAVGGSSAQNFNYDKFKMLLNSKIYYYKKWSPNLMLFIKTIVLVQILVQYLKGKWGNDLRRLLSIYFKSV